MKRLFVIFAAIIVALAVAIYLTNLKRPEIKVTVVYEMAACDECNLLRITASADESLIGSDLTPRGPLAEQAANMAIQGAEAGACLAGRIYRFNPLAGYIEPYDYRFDVAEILDITDCTENQPLK